MSRSLFEGTDRDHPGLALGLILAAIAVLSFQDATVKLVSGQTSLWQFQTVRGVFNLGFLALFLGLSGRLGLFVPKNPVAVAARTVLSVITMLLFFSAAPVLTLAEMGAGLYTYPVFMSLLGWAVLGERVGPWRLLAVAMAALGAVLIIRPGTDGFHPAQLLPVGAGLSYAASSIFVRRWCREESSFTLAAWLAGGFLVTCLAGGGVIGALPLAQESRADYPFLLNAWPALTLSVAGFALVASVCNLLGNLMIVKAYQSAELSWLAPFDYTYLVLATFWGWLLFSDLPDAVTVAGMGLIGAAGVLTALRRARPPEIPAGRSP